MRYIVTLFMVFSGACIQISSADNHVLQAFTQAGDTQAAYEGNELLENELSQEVERIREAIFQHNNDIVALETFQDLLRPDTHDVLSVEIGLDLALAPRLLTPDLYATFNNLCAQLAPVRAVEQGERENKLRQLLMEKPDLGRRMDDTLRGLQRLHEIHSESVTQLKNALDSVAGRLYTAQDQISALREASREASDFLARQMANLASFDPHDALIRTGLAPRGSSSQGISVSEALPLTKASENSLGIDQPAPTSQPGVTAALPALSELTPATTAAPALPAPSELTPATPAAPAANHAFETVSPAAAESKAALEKDARELRNSRLRMGGAGLFLLLLIDAIHGGYKAHKSYKKLSKHERTYMKALSMLINEMLVVKGVKKLGSLVNNAGKGGIDATTSLFSKKRSTRFDDQSLSM